ncbi:MAG: AraC family transcriptional regulator [Bacteroidaceae bacterium]|nr:AraC family transcriptional regulator [Bacteroidaceae bacterium]
MARQMTRNVFFSGMPDFGQVMYEQGLALYDTLEGFRQGGVEDCCDVEFVDYPVRAQMVMFILCVSGRIGMRLNLQDYVMTDGDVMVVRPNTIYESLRLSAGSKVAALMVADTFYHLFPRNHQAGPLPAIDPVAVCADEALVAHLVNIYHRMRDVIHTEDFSHKEDALRGYLQVASSILDSLCDRMEAQQHKPADKSSRSEAIYTRFVSDVHSHFRQHRDTAFYAGLQCVTPKYFGQMVRRASGRMPSDIIGEYVILEAKMLLRSEHYTVQQVCNLLNFPNPSFFGKYFKAHVGQTPRQFAEQTERKQS